MPHKKQAPRAETEASKRTLPPSSLREPARVPTPPFHPATVARMKAQPLALNAREVMQLQRSFGNRAVGRLLSAARQRRPAAPAAETDSGALGVARRGENTTGLPDGLKAGVEHLSGLALDDVRVHYNSDAPARVGALAYTQGTDIHVAPRQERHLAHEVWHVVQQKRGRVRPTLRQEGLEVNEDSNLETEADVMGARALDLSRAASVPPQLARVETVASLASPLSSSPMQLQRFKTDAEATTWLTNAITALVNTYRAQSPDNFARARMETYLAKLGANLYKYEEMQKLLRLHGGDYYAEAHRAGNLNDQLAKETVIEAAMSQLRGTELTHHYGAKGRTVSEAQKEHIFLGTVNNKVAPTTVTGYHWEGDAASVAVSSGAKQNAEAKFGVYQRGVVARARPTTRKAGGSATASTFFPETWSKAEVLEAIEYAQTNGQRLEARTPGKAVGLMILSNEDSYFPDAPGNQPA
jgi:hypothetical protein